MATGAMTEKQRRALEAMEAARRQGCSLTEHAKAQGLAVREIYDALAALRRKGVLPKAAREPKSKFVSVRVTHGARANHAARLLWWAANTRFLDRLIARGDQVFLATNAADAGAGTFFTRELEYLISRGYTLSDDGWRLLPPEMR